MKRLPFFLAAMAFTGDAHAERSAIGARSSVAIVIDDLFGLGRTTYASESDTNEQSLVTIGSRANVYALGETRVGVHAFLSPSFSVGTSLRWYHYDSGPKSTILGFAPRVGLILPAGSTGAIWIRAGAGYEHWDLGHDYVAEYATVGGEIQYVGTPVANFGWTVGPYVETDVSASLSHGDVSGRMPKRTTLGLAFGVLFDF